ncbi:hypothetical protein JCM11491_000440 [Sporobolomyces phaffii]
MTSIKTHATTSSSPPPSSHSTTTWKAQTPWDIDPDQLDDEQVEILGALLPVVNIEERPRAGGGGGGGGTSTTTTTTMTNDPRPVSRHPYAVARSSSSSTTVGRAVENRTSFASLRDFLDRPLPPLPSVTAPHATRPSPPPPVLLRGGFSFNSTPPIIRGAVESVPASSSRRGGPGGSERAGRESGCSVSHSQSESKDSAPRGAAGASRASISVEGGRRQRGDLDEREEQSERRGSATTTARIEERQARGSESKEKTDRFAGIDTRSNATRAVVEREELLESPRRRRPLPPCAAPASRLDDDDHSPTPRPPRAFGVDSREVAHSPRLRSSSSVASSRDAVIFRN